MEMLPYIKKMAEHAEIAAKFNFSQQELQFLIGEKAVEVMEEKKKVRKTARQQKTLF